MEQYNVTGMSCAACQARVEKAVSNVPGVESCSVSLLTNSMGVEGTATPEISSFSYISCCAYVFQHGTYDVGLAASVST